MMVQHIFPAVEGNWKSIPKYHMNVIIELEITKWANSIALKMGYISIADIKGTIRV